MIRFSSQLKTIENRTDKYNNNKNTKQSIKIYEQKQRRKTK